MIEIKKPGSYVCCNTCFSNKNVLQIYFRNNNTGTVISLCENCRMELSEKIERGFLQKDETDE